MGTQFIAKAFQLGASAVVCEKLPDTIHEKIATTSPSKDSAQALGIIAANFYGNPSQKLKLVGVTGTNGKTTVRQRCSISFLVRWDIAQD